MADMQPVLRRVRANETELAYFEQGEGVPIVFVHGSLGDYRSWGLQVEPFSKRYRAIAYSRRYHHPNPWTGDGSDYSAALHAEDLAALLVALGATPAHIVSSSYGSYTALVMAARRPDLVRALVVGEPPLLPWLQRSPEGRPLHDAFMSGAWTPAGRALRDGRLEEGVRRFIDGVGGQGVFDAMPDPVRQRALDNAPEMRAETTSPVYFTEFSCDDAARITTPALLLTGEVSPRMFHVITDDLARCIPDPGRATIPGASHSMHAGNPEAYNQTVLAFLAAH